MTQKLIIHKIEGSLEQLIQRAHLRAKDLERLEAITSTTRRQEWLMSRVVAWESRGVHIDTNESGAPTIDGGYISISHAGGYVAVLLSDEPCGVDIEVITRDAAKISRKFATQDELNTAKESFDINPSLLLWCAKEALYKRAGVAGADFIVDLNVIRVSHDTLIARAYYKQYELQYKLQDGLLIVTL